MAWITIPDSDVDPESPITTSLMQALRDNPVAIAGALSGAPDVIQLDAVLDKIRFKTIAIGNWDMDATTFVSVAHGLTLANIRSIFALIRDDADSLGTNLGRGVSVTDTTPQGYVSAANSTDVILARLTGGLFDATTYNDPAFNRGWVTIIYAVP